MRCLHPACPVIKDQQRHVHSHDLRRAISVPKNCRTVCPKMQFSHRLSTRHPGDMQPVLCAKVYLQQSIPFACSSERDLLVRIIFTLFPPRLLYVRLQNGRSRSKSWLKTSKNHAVRSALTCDRFSAAGTKIFVAFDSATLRKNPRCLESECLNSAHVNFLCLVLKK